MIKTNEILIVALDFSSVDEAMKLVDQLGSTVNFYKVGLELFSAKDSHIFIDWLKSKGKKVFLDLKMFDIPETVFRAASQHRIMGVDYTTVHGCSTESVQSAVLGMPTGVLAVTILTSHKAGVDRCLVEHHARNALEVGATGAVMSGWEAEGVKLRCGSDFIVVCPGIRDTDMERHDQQSTIGVEAAIENGANHLVMGRPITRHENPAEIADSIQQRIEAIVDKGYDIAD